MRTDKLLIDNPNKQIYEALKLVMSELIYQARQNKAHIERLSEADVYELYKINKSHWLNKQNAELSKWESQLNELG
jgi:hypothetical protein